MSNAKQADELNQAIDHLERAVVLGKTTPLYSLNAQQKRTHLRFLKDCEKHLASLVSLRNKITASPFN